MNKYRVLFILHLPPPVHGAAMMGKYIKDSKLVNETFDCHYINLTTASSLEDIGKGGLRKAVKFLRLLREVRRTIKHIKPQLVYITPNATAPAFYKDFVLVQMVKLLGCKIVVHYHNKGVTTRQDRWLDNILYRTFFKNIKVILLAEVLYNDVKKYVRREDVLICPNGIPKTLTEEPTAQRNNAIHHLLFLSNLIVSKGVLLLLDACKILKERGYSFICEFVGGETSEIDAARFEREVLERNLNEVALYRGRKYDNEKHDAFSKADIFVFPTFYPNECFPLVLLEAMEHKLPIVTTNEGAIAEMVNDEKTGFIVDKNNAEQLALAIGNLLDDLFLCQSFGEIGYLRFTSLYTLHVFENRFHDCLCQVFE